jgi:hypothetical protein
VGGDGVKFGDMGICVATMAVILVLLIGPLGMVFVSVWGLASGYMVSLAVAVFLSALIGGLVFAGKIGEGGMAEVAKITVLWAVLVMLMVGLGSATLADLGSMVKEGYEGQYGTTLTTSEWVNLESMHYDQFMTMTTGLVLLLGFVGLYVGSMLRKPRKS